VADYGVNIAVAVKNSQAVTQLSNKVKDTAAKIEEVNNHFNTFTNMTGKVLPGSIGNFNKALSDAAKNLNTVALNTEEAVTAAREFVEAQREANAALRERDRLVRQVQLAGETVRKEPFGTPGLPGGPQLPKGFRARQLALEAIEEGKKAQTVFNAERKFADQLFDIEMSLSKKLRDAEIDNIIKEYELENRLQDTLFKKQVEAADERAKSFMEELGFKKGEELKAIKEVDKARRKAASEAIRLTGQTSPIGGAVGIPGSPAALAAAERAKRIKAAQGSALIGGAFPLLFGQGLGAAFGGAAGGFGGGMIGGEFGFGLSLVGTQIGSLIDQLAQNAADLGKALNPATADVNALVEALGLVGSPIQDSINSLKDLAGEQVALEAATRQLSLVVGDDGVQALADFGEASTQFANAVTQVTTQVLAQIAKLTSGIVKEVANTIEFGSLLAAAKASDDPRQKDLQEKLANVRIKPGERGVNFESAIIEAEMVEVQRKIRAEEEGRLQAAVERTRAGSAERKIAQNNLKIAQLNSDLTNQQVFDLMKKNVTIDAENKKLAEGADTRLIDLNAQQQITDLTNSRNALLETANKKAAGAADKANDQLIAAQNLSAEFSRELKIREQTSKLDKDLARVQAEYEKRLERISKLDNQSLRVSQEQLALDILAVDTANALADAAERLTSAKMFETPLQIFGEDSAFAADFENSIMGAIRTQEELDKVLEKYPMIEQASQAMATTVTSGFAEIVSGAKSAEQVFAEFLRSIADMLISTAQRMIAQYIALGIARMFAIPGSTYQPKFDGASLFSGQTVDFMPFGSAFTPMAKGGAVGANKPYLVGERGPELFVPGAQGNIVPNHAMGGANIVVNVDASGTQAQGDQPNAKALGSAIGAAVQAELIKQKRPGGLLA
tara:strand:- start:173 stop:2878 length:2706 start_codon:yes stop_codon:yes gene_type:complete